MLELKAIFKRWLSLTSAITLCFCLQAWSSEVLFSSTSIEVRWESPGRFSSEDLVRHRDRALEIADFYEKQVLPSVPATLWNGRKPPFVSVQFRSDLPTDGGLFVPSRFPLTLQIHSSLILSSDSERTLAHEYFHAIHWIFHSDEPAWLKEGLAQLFETRVFARGKFNTNHLAAGFSTPSTSLVNDIHVNAISHAHYGHLLMYFWYLYERCGGEDLFWKLAAARSETYGILTIESALRELGSSKKGCGSFSESVAEFELARALNVKTLGGEDPERWFLLYSSLAKASFQKALPTQATWANAGPWTPYFIAAEHGLTEVTGYAGARVWWLIPGLNAEAVETRIRPSPRFTRMLILKADGAARPRKR